MEYCKLFSAKVNRKGLRDRSVSVITWSPPSVCHQPVLATELCAPCAPSCPYHLFSSDPSRAAPCSTSLTHPHARLTLAIIGKPECTLHPHFPLAASFCPYSSLFSFVTQICQFLELMVSQVFFSHPHITACPSFSLISLPAFHFWFST